MKKEKRISRIVLLYVINLAMGSFDFSPRALAFLRSINYIDIRESSTQRNAQIDAQEIVETQPDYSGQAEVRRRCATRTYE